ncbi:hypothetical protein Cgig2_009749 [Carnegiea gigantea]|uniref:Uncharacterized protein n=1 Tax=Carnegiea gigantea TaxID=171969 RepID=A0A9Q1JV13_9CARY|nr:hypothetical protein Cgig2_009749 [Carnegiea gigantea]
MYTHYTNKSPKANRKTLRCTSNISIRNPLPPLEQFIVPNEKKKHTNAGIESILTVHQYDPGDASQGEDIATGATHKHSEPSELCSASSCGSPGFPLAADQEGQVSSKTWKGPWSQEEWLVKCGHRVTVNEGKHIFRHEALQVTKHDITNPCCFGGSGLIAASRIAIVEIHSDGEGRGIARTCTSRLGPSNSSNAT